MLIGLDSAYGVKISISTAASRLSKVTEKQQTKPDQTRKLINRCYRRINWGDESLQTKLQSGRSVTAVPPLFQTYSVWYNSVKTCKNMVNELLLLRMWPNKGEQVH